MRRFGVILALACALALLGSTSASAKLGDYEKHFVSAGEKYGLNPNLLKAIAYRESGISQPNPICNSFGYCGVMQINRVVGPSIYARPKNNIQEGARHFKSCMSSVPNRNNVIEALVCYNAGLGRVSQMHNGSLAYIVVKRKMPDFGQISGRVPTWGNCTYEDNTPQNVHDVCAYVHYIIDRYNWYEGRTPYSKNVDKKKLEEKEIYVDSLYAPGFDKLGVSKKPRNELLKVLALFAIGLIYLKLRRTRDHSTRQYHSRRRRL